MSKKIFWWAIFFLLMATPRFHSLLGEILGGKAYRANTLEFLAENKAGILRWAAHDSIPPIALAGAVGGEYNAGLGTRAVVDLIQDGLLLNFLPEWMLALDQSRDIPFKWMNVMEHDGGVGNMRIRTALELTKKYRSEFPAQWSDKDAIGYLLSTEGAFRMASLYMKEAKNGFAPYLANYSESEKEAIYVTYYFQGPSYLERFKEKNGEKQVIQAEEGARVSTHRAKLHSALYE